MDARDAAPQLPAIARGGPIPGGTALAGTVTSALLGLDGGGPPLLGRLVRALWASRDRLDQARAILDAGCERCAVGPPRHLCAPRLDRLREHTAGTLAPFDVGDVQRLRRMLPAGLRALGRLPYPFVRRAGSRGFERIAWAAALDLAGGWLRAVPADRQAWLVGRDTSTNEALYAFGKAARALGAAPGLAEGRGSARRATVALDDVVGTDLLLLWGLRLGDEHPGALPVLRAAARAGTRIVAIHADGAPRLADDVVRIRPGGEGALARAVLHLLGTWGVTPELPGRLDDLLDAAGVPYAVAEWVARLAARARTGASAWPARLSSASEDAIAELHAARGWVDRPRCGLLPVDDHATWRGARDMGIDAGLVDAPDAVVQLGAGPPREGARYRIHVATHLDAGMLADAEQAVLWLPALTRFEQKGGGTVTSADGDVWFTPEIPGHAPADARSGIAIPGLLAAAAQPVLGAGLAWPESWDVRREIAATIPGYLGVDRLRAPGDHLRVRA